MLLGVDAVEDVPRVPALVAIPPALEAGAANGELVVGEVAGGVANAEHDALPAEDSGEAVVHGDQG